MYFYIKQARGENSILEIQEEMGQLEPLNNAK